MTKDEVIETLSDLRSQYNCFDEKEEPYYMALCIAIKSVRIAEHMNKAIPKVIHCKECKYADAYFHCQYVSFLNKPNDYCSRGEEKE